MTNRCHAVVIKEDNGPIVPGDLVYVCGAAECRLPFPAYIPLCGAHRAMAEVKEIPVLTGDKIAEFRL